MMEEFYVLFDECIFIPKDNKYFCGGMEVKLIQIYPQIFNRKMPVRYYVGHFMGLVENHDVLGVTTKTDELTLTFQTFRIIHKKLNVDISDLSYDEIVHLKRTQKIDKILS